MHGHGGPLTAAGGPALSLEEFAHVFALSEQGRVSRTPAMLEIRRVVWRTKDLLEDADPTPTVLDPPRPSLTVLSLQRHRHFRRMVLREEPVLFASTE